MVHLGHMLGPGSLVSGAVPRHRLHMHAGSTVYSFGWRSPRPGSRIVGFAGPQLEVTGMLWKGGSESGLDPCYSGYTDEWWT